MKEEVAITILVDGVKWGFTKSNFDVLTKNGKKTWLSVVTMLREKKDGVNISIAFHTTYKEATESLKKSEEDSFYCFIAKPDKESPEYKKHKTLPYKIKKFGKNSERVINDITLSLAVFFEDKTELELTDTTPEDDKE